MKKRFVAAYCWMFGSTKEEAARVYRTADADYIAAVIAGHEDQCRRAFRDD